MVHALWFVYVAVITVIAFVFGGSMVVCVYRTANQIKLSQVNYHWMKKKRVVDYSLITCTLVKRSIFETQKAK